MHEVDALPQKFERLYVGQLCVSGLNVLGFCVIHCKVVIIGAADIWGDTSSFLLIVGMMLCPKFIDWVHAIV